MEAGGGEPLVAVDPGNPLLRAVFLRRLRLTRLLLDGGAYVDESDGRGRTPLMVACGTQHLDGRSAGRDKLVRFLLDRGADPNLQDRDGRSALMHACRERAGAAVAALLLAGGADAGLEDRTGTSALVHAVAAGDLQVLRLLLDACKAKGKEVIIIATETFPCGGVRAQQYLSTPPRAPPGRSDGAAAAAPASPSEIQLITSPPCSSSSCSSCSSSSCSSCSSSSCSSCSSSSKPVFSFREVQVCGSPSRFRGSGLQRLNSEPWLTVPPSLLSQRLHAASDRTEEDVSSTVPELDEDRLVPGGGQQRTSLPGLLSGHSASHPDLHSSTLTPSTSSTLPGGKILHPASSSLRSIIQRRRLGAALYGSDPQLALGARDPAEARRLAPLRGSSRESLSGASGRFPSGSERRGSGALPMDHGCPARPRSLPPLNNGPAPKGLLPSAPPGPPTRRTLLRRHSMQTEQFKGTA